MTQRIELLEWDRQVVPAPDPTREDLDLLGRLEGDLERRLEIRWLRDGRIDVRSRSWVGVVRLSNLTISVRPKFAGYELGVLRMLSYSGGYRAFRTLDSPRKLPEDGVDLLDLICLLLAEQTENILRDGLLRDYRTREDSLTTLRGLLRIRDQAVRRFGQLDVLECRFDEFESDVLENQLLRSGLAAAARLCGDTSTRQRLRRLEVATAELCSVGPVDASYYRQRLTYTRRNERYRHAHELALLLLERLGVDDIFGSGRTDSVAFLINMNDVFEDFVTAVVNEAFEKTPWQASGQHREGRVILNRHTGKRYSSIIPDIVLSSGQEQVPFDCKYKLYGKGGKKISSGDIYQSFLYAYALSDGHFEAVGRAGIIYPASITGTSHHLEIKRLDGPVGARLTGISLDLLAMLRSLEDRQTWQETLSTVRDVVGSVLAVPSG